MKKEFMILLALVLFISSGAYVHAESTYTAERRTSGGFEYILLEDGTVEITGYSGKAKELSIPEEINQFKVTSIGEMAFYWCSKLTNVTIPEGVTHIGEAAFYLCSNLSSVTIPKSVTKIEANPFVSCENLAFVYVSPDHSILATIDGVLFNKLDKRLVWYPNTKKDMEYKIPNGIKVIGIKAFSGCKNLTRVLIPDSVKTIEKEAFYNCMNLTSIVIPDKMESIGDSAFWSCSRLIDMTIPDSVTSIGDYAFMDCYNLTNVTIPDSVRYIGENPFKNCENLATVQVSLDHPVLTTINGVLFFKPDKKLIWYPMTRGETEYVIPQGIKSIGDSAFWFCSDLASVIIPDSVAMIGDYAFTGCGNLISVTIPDSVTSIGDLAFASSNRMNNAPNPELIVSVYRDSYAAQYCEDNGIKYIYPDSLNWLDD